MVDIRLPDDSIRSYPGPVTGMEVAESISSGLAKNSLAIKIDGELSDLSVPITQDAAVEIIVRGKGNQDAIELIRHDCAHVLADAAQSLFPGTQVTIGPSIENGFYYDFYREEPFTTDDLEKLEKRMGEIIAKNEPFKRSVVSREDAIALFKSKGEEFKVELIQDLGADQEISLYSQGEWIDLCRGPHAPSTGFVGKSFKLMSVAGAYWRGDSNRAQLQRIYGTAWEDSKQLKAYLHMLEEAAKRDHRKLGREMDLFHLQEEAVGSVFWHAKGWTTYRMMEQYMRKKLEAADYIEVKTPQLVDRKLWEASGHWEKFREAMFTSEDDDSDRVLALKPMNCPCHVQIFNQGIKSYRDLPLRMAEFGSCHRNEPSGALHGIMRVRNFTQDDAHIFCTEDQIESESVIFCDLLMEIYKDFGFTEVSVKFSDRPEVRAGSDETWDRAETALKGAIEAADLPYTMNPGEGAFYGPKLEFVLKDAIGRDWQCGTLQVDFVLPERLDALFVDADGERKRPVMLHRAILGSFERFMGMLIENYSGRLPLWLAPVQCVVAPITSDADGYATEILERLQKAGVRATSDLRNEKINYKIREHSKAKVPVMFIVGRQEMEKGTVAQRVLAGKDQEFLALDDAVNRLLEDIRMPG